MASGNPTLRDGVAMGLIAYVGVAVFYTGFDILAVREPLYTVDLLGKVAFRGVRTGAGEGAPFQPDYAAIFLYNALHLVLSLSLGLAVAWLVERAQRHRQDAWLSLFVLVGGFAGMMAVAGLLTAPVRELLPTWSIVSANLYAVTLAGIYLLWRRPGVWRALLPFLARKDA
jgi:hypothetical protein